MGTAARSIRGELFFVYPPLVAALLSPFVRIPFLVSFWAWTAVGLVASLGSLTLLIRTSGAGGIVPTPVILLLALGYVPFSLNAALGGQIPWVGITLLALVASAFLRQRDFLAGPVMSLSYYPPPLFLLLLVVLCLGRGRKFILGFFAGAILLVGLSSMVVGPEGLLAYLATASRYTYGQNLPGDTTLVPSYGMGFVGLGYSLFSPMRATLVALALPFAAVALAGVGLVRSRREDRLLLELLFSIS